MPEPLTAAPTPVHTHVGVTTSLAPPALATPAPQVLLEPRPLALQQCAPHPSPAPEPRGGHPLPHTGGTPRRWSQGPGLTPACRAGAQCLGRAGLGPGGKAGPHPGSPTRLEPGLTCVLGLVVPIFVVPRGWGVCKAGERAMREAACSQAGPSPGRASPCPPPLGAPRPGHYLPRAR